MATTRPWQISIHDMILVLNGLPGGKNIRKSINVFFLYYIGDVIFAMTDQYLHHVGTVTRVLPDTIDSEKLVECKS
jgi:hypothetical protein